MQHLLATFLGSTSMRTERRQCARHGAYDAMVTERGGRKLVGRCPACMDEQIHQEYAQDSKAILDECEQRKFEHLFGQSGIPERFKERTFENYRVQPGNAAQDKAYRIARKYAVNFEDRMKHGGGLVLAGNPGTGKTHLAAAIANHIMGLGRSALFMTTYDAIDRVKDSWRKDSGVSERDAVARMVKPDLLILDEVGVQFGSGAEQIILFKILNARYEAFRPTILISNLRESEIGVVIGERVVDRMREGGGAVVPFTWNSYRSQAGQDPGLPGAHVVPVDR